MTKTQKKNALKAIESKAGKLCFALVGTEKVISIADYQKISDIVKRSMKKLG